MVRHTNFPAGPGVLMTGANDDAVWVARCLKGDSAAFETLVRRYQQVLFTVALKLTGSEEDARDVTQNAFVRAFLKLDSFDPSRKFFSWLYRIAVNESLNARRDRRTHEPLEDRFEAVTGGDPVERLEASGRVQAGLMALSSEYREVIIMRYFAELSYEEIAEAIGIPEKTVKSRLFSARQRLGEILSEGSVSS
jgi:RNA polymerase sigma-70 factor (ECF subfamily)